jgi:phage tail sheath protein FI
MPEYLYPGVYVEEQDTGNQPIEGVSTSTVGFVGVAERGPSAATLCTSFSDYARAFGKYVKESSGTQRYLAYGVEGFFQNGGKRCFVARVYSSTAALASRGDANMNVQALAKGEWGNRVAVKISDLGSGRFRLVLMYWSVTPPTPIVDPTSTNPTDLRDPNRRDPQLIEVFDDMSANPNDARFYERVVNGQSTLVTVTQLAGAQPGSVSPPALMTNGGDGGALAPVDFTGDAADPPGSKRGLDALTEIDEISLLASPDEFGLGEGVGDITNGLRDQCELMLDRFAILNAKSIAGSPGTLVPPFASKYAAIYYPWINISDPYTGKLVLVPPCGHIAGIYARSDNERGVHKDPANEPILGIDSLQFNLTDQQQALINPRGVNALRYFRGVGNIVWGGRTISNNPSWRYINVRRLFIFVEKSILRAMQWAVFEINDEPLWARIKRSVSDFLLGLWMDGMLQGATKEQAFFVKCDRTTMTQADIDNGRLICLIGIAPVKPAEFVIFRIGQWDGGQSVDETQ